MDKDASADLHERELLVQGEVVVVTGVSFADRYQALEGARLGLGSGCGLLTTHFDSYYQIKSGFGVPTFRNLSSQNC